MEDLSDKLLDAMKHLIDSVYWYTFEDEGWIHVDTPEASRLRSEMYSALRKIALISEERTLSDDDLGRIFDWRE